MNLKQYAISISLCLAMLTVAADANGQVYRWVDENGVVHYGDRAPQGVEATRVGVNPNTVPIARPESSPPPAEAPTESAGDPAEALSYAELRRRERAEQRQQNLEIERARTADCARVRKTRNLLEPSPRVIVQDEDGNPRRLDDNERLRLLEESQQFLAKYCDRN